MKTYELHDPSRFILYISQRERERAREMERALCKEHEDIPCIAVLRIAREEEKKKREKSRSLASYTTAAG